MAADPYWNRVVLLALNDNAPDPTTIFRDQGPKRKSLTTIAAAQYDNAQAPPGMLTSVLFNGVTPDGVSSSPYPDTEFKFRTGDFTIECMFRTSNNILTQSLIDLRDNGAGDSGPVLYMSTDGSIRVYVSGDLITGTAGAIANNTWYHITVSRASGSIKLFIDGTQNGSTSSDTNDYDKGGLHIGTDQALTIANGVVGWLSNVRLTKGIARYTANFVKPQLPFPRGPSGSIIRTIMGMP